MDKPIKRFARIGINHHLLFPQSMTDAAFHAQTLPRMLAMSEFELVDLFVPLQTGEAHRRRQMDIIRQSGKTIVYDVPLLTAGGLNPSSPDAAVRQRTLDEARAHVSVAMALGASKAVVASGPDPGEPDREAARAAFTDFLCALCSTAGLTVLVEPFDRSIGKNLLIGPSREAAAVVQSVRRAGHANAGILVDMGHLPLMGESFRDALAACGSLVGHVHLGNCVRRNPASPYYGDMHPPLGIPDGEHDEPELVRFLSALLEAGYLPPEAAEEGAPRESLPTVAIEARPYPGFGEEESARIMLAKMKRAWEQV